MKNNPKPKLAPKRKERGIPKKIVRYKHGQNYRRIKDEIQQIQLKINDHFDDEQMTAAVVLLAALEVGQDIDTLYRFLGYNVPKSHIAWMKIHLEKNGVWKNDKTYCSWMEENGYLAFICDVMVACNVLQRA